MPFAGAAFDFATAFVSLMDMSDQAAALAEAYRVLRPGSFLQFSILHPCFVPPHRRVLREVDQRLRETDPLTAEAAAPASTNFDREFAILAEMERELGQEKVPLSYMQEFYHLRLHTDFLRRRLQQRLDGQSPRTAEGVGGTPEAEIVPG